MLAIRFICRAVYEAVPAMLRTIAMFVFPGAWDILVKLLGE